jgi:deoxyribodipyrimidine photo-lyase
MGAELIVRIGNPAEILPELALQYRVNEVYHHREVADEETAISEEVETALWKIKLNLKHFIGHTLYHKEDLPIPIKDIPDSFSTFKKKVERDSNVRPCAATPDVIAVPAITGAGEMPTLEQLGLPQPIDDPRAVNEFIGGETTGLNKLAAYFQKNNSNNSSKTNRNGSADNSSKLSPWLALGCISPRQVYWEAASHDSHGHPSGQLILELLWRDYFRFMFKKHGQKFYKAEALADESKALTSKEEELFEAWKTGHTSVPFIDASMHELNATGYINNFSRQVVAGYLVRDLDINWVKGAAYFEEKLIDYSPASNWGNWAFIAGMAHDPRDNRYFNITKQASELETKGSFVDTWLPEIADGPGQVIAL